MSSLDKFRLSELQSYLKARGVTVTGYNKPALQEIAKAVERIDLPVDPDFHRDSVESDITRKLNAAGLGGTNPFDLQGYTSDFSNAPNFGLIDIFNYMIFNKSEYDGKKLKGYKSFEDYRLFYDGHVESLLFNPISDKSEVCLFKSQVRPTQRDKTYANKSYYSLWFVLDKGDGCVVTGHCDCIGGADGACRHLAASLYELEAFEIKSCTSGENQWMKRPRSHDAPLPVRNLKIIKTRYGDVREESSKPHSDLYDPRPEDQQTPITDDSKREFGLRVKEISEQAQALDILLNADDMEQNQTENNDEDILQLSIKKVAERFMESINGHSKPIGNSCEEFYSSIKLSSSDAEWILKKTEGQTSNTNWYKLRKGLLTASNFAQACKYIDNGKAPSATFINSILGNTYIDDANLPAPLKWGREKEVVAREMYRRLVRKQHNRVKILEKGLFISTKYPVLGCSLDGLRSCQCKPSHHLRIVEIKCPYSQRNSPPKDVAAKADCIINKDSGNWTVLPSCPYYAQIQGQLGLYEIEEADLVIYTSKGIHISQVKYDDQFFQDMLSKLLKFYKQYVIPELLKPDKHKSMIEE